MTLLLKNTLPETLADFLDREIQQYSDWLERMTLERELIQAVGVVRRKHQRILDQKTAHTRTEAALTSPHARHTAQTKIAASPTR
jgi:hypothetical protein